MKSKALKQQEAIERKLQHVRTVRSLYLESLPGTKLYKQVEASWGTEHADHWHLGRKRQFERLCAECRIDVHGNPLEK